MWRPLRSSDRSRVEHRLRDKVQSLRQAAAKGRVLDADTVQQAEVLQKILELDLVARDRPWRYLVVSGAVALALIVGLLLLQRVDTVGVEGVVHASSVQVYISGGPILLFDQPLYDFAGAGFTALSGIPQPVNTNSKNLLASQLPGGFVTLQQITLPEGARVGVEWDGTRVNVQVEASQASGHGRANITLSGATQVIIGRDTLGLQSDELLELDFGPARFDMSFMPVDSIVDLVGGINADSISFSETSRTTDDTRTNRDLVSTIVGGELSLSGMQDPSVSLHPHEHLQLRSEKLQIHRIRFDPSRGIVVEFRASASSLLLGTDRDQRELRPSVLEWYAASRPLQLVRVAYVSALVMLVGMLHFFRRSR